MSEGECRTRAFARVVSNLNQPIQPKTTYDEADVFTMAVLDAVRPENQLNHAATASVDGVSWPKPRPPKKNTNHEE